MQAKLVVSAYATALKLIAGNARMRSLMLRPFLTGLALYIVAIAIGFYFFSSISAALTPDWGGWLLAIITPLVWLASILIVIIGSLLLVAVLTLSLLGILQTPLAEQVLTLNHIALPATPTTPSGLTKNLIWESVKLVVAIGLTITAVIIGFIPILLPVSVVISAWIIGFESFDVALDAAGHRIRSRVRVIFSHPFLVLLSGLGGVILAIIPFAAVVMPSIAVISATNLIVKRSLLPGPKVVIS